MRVRSRTFVLSGAVGGLVAGLVLELFVGGGSAAGWGGRLLEAALYFAVFGLAVGAALGMTEGLARRDRLRTIYGAFMGLMLGLLGGAAGGALGQALYGLVPRQATVGGTTDLALVIDSSGSMRELLVGGSDPGGERKKAAKKVVDKLSASDRVAVIDFDDDAQVLAPLTELSSKAVRQSLKQAIDGIDSSGGTNISAGIDAGVAQLAAVPAPDRSRAMIFLTDGVGAFFDGSVGGARAAGVQIYTVGLGDQVNAGMLEMIATSTSGRYFPVAQAGELTKIFEHILEEHGSMLRHGTAIAATGAEKVDRRWLFLFLRVASWALVGLAIGLGQGVRENSREDLRACSIGGFLGGAVGGALFEGLGLMAGLGTSGWGRALADIVVGASIGGSMRLLQEKTVDVSSAPPRELFSLLPANSRAIRLEPAGASAPTGDRRLEPPRVAPPEGVRATVPPVSVNAIPAVSEQTKAALRKPLQAYEREHSDRDRAMAMAYTEGGYNLREVAEHFGVTLPAVRRAADTHRRQ